MLNVSGTVKFSVDLRHTSDDALTELEVCVAKELNTIADKAGAKLKFEKTWHSPAINFHPDNIACVKKSVESAGFTSRPIRSGAGHDSVYTSKRVPTSMIFCPSKDGISHNPAEFSTDDECSAAAQTLCKFDENVLIFLTNQVELFCFTTKCFEKDTVKSFLTEYYTIAIMPLTRSWLTKTSENS